MARAKKAAVTRERLQQLLAYDPDAGTFSWRMNRGLVKAGSAAGSHCAAGYLTVRLDGTSYYCHRLAWLYTHGRWPLGQIDHVNSIRTDNRISNLRECTNSQNCQNVRHHRDGISRYLGVTWDRSRRKWLAQIFMAGKKFHLGRFDNEEAASAAYLAAKARLHSFNPDIARG